MEHLVKFLVYRKNPLRQLGIIGLKKAHLEANELYNQNILQKVAAEFGPHEKLTNAQRTLAQFKCQESLYSNSMQKWMSRVLFAALAPVVFAIFLLEYFRKSTTKVVDVFVFNYGSLSYAKSEFKTENLLSGIGGQDVRSYLGRNEIRFIAKTILKNPEYLLHPKLVVNVLRWITTYAWVVKYHKPKIIATFLEGTASSSLLTEFLNQQGIKHFNFAHGEHFRFDCYSAYANFDRYVIWGKHFKDIQIEKNCRPEMFELRAPDHFKKYFFEIREIPKKNQKQITVLIHSGVEKGQTEYNHLLALISNLDSGWTVVLRPHPVDRASWPQVKLDLEYDLKQQGKMDSLKEEYPEKVLMRESVQNSPIFVGSASAALLEALLAGCKIIYLPGRVKNTSVIERHKNSKNVYSYRDDSDIQTFKQFLQSEFVKSEEEDLKIKNLFQLDD